MVNKEGNPRRQTVSVGGIRVDALCFDELVAILSEAQASEGRVVIYNHNLHSLYLHRTDPAFREAYEKATWIYIDGLHVLWLARLAGFAIKPECRITFLDCFEPLLSKAEQLGWRVFYLGSREETLREGLRILKGRFPSLELQGRNGYFHGADEIADAVSEIKRFRPDVLFVGMGMPAQERFLSRHLHALHFGAALTSGATMDYVAGSVYKPPLWAGRLGLYGVLRFCRDPRRLWKRYLWEPLVLLRLLGPAIVRQRLKPGRLVEHTNQQ